MQGFYLRSYVVHPFIFGIYLYHGSFSNIKPGSKRFRSVGVSGFTLLCTIRGCVDEIWVLSVTLRQIKDGSTSSEQWRRETKRAVFGKQNGSAAPVLLYKHRLNTKVKPRNGQVYFSGVTFSPATVDPLFGPPLGTHVFNPCFTQELMNSFCLFPHFSSARRRRRWAWRQFCLANVTVKTKS